MKKFFTILDSRQAFKILLILNFSVSIFVFYNFQDWLIGNKKHYLNFADGLDHGRFSQWWFFPDYYPDASITPGYPFFLFMMEKISSNIYFIKCIQFLLYILSVYMILEISGSYQRGYVLKNIFLILLLPYIHVAIFSPAIGPEILMTFLMTTYVYVDSRNMQAEYKYTFLGLLSGIIFLVDPLFLYFPFLVVVTNLIILKRKYPLKLGFSMLIIYMLTILPFGLWNLKHHHILSLTPIEETWSFKNSNPIVVNESKESEEIILNAMESFPRLFKTYNTAFFLASIILFPLALFRRRICWRDSLSVICLLLYFGFINLPFAMSAPFEISLRLILLLMLARAIVCLVNKQNTKMYSINTEIKTEAF
jgi:4-amino-4-deoxy-L-arabinose transferase-like glycosyltransferase